MRELYNEDPANRVGLESCVGDPRGRSEALTEGVRAGLLSRETTLIPGCRRRPHSGRRDCWRRYSRVAGESSRILWCDGLSSSVGVASQARMRMVTSSLPGWWSGYARVGVKPRPQSAAVAAL